MSKKRKNTSLLDYFSPQAKKRKENAFEDSSANTSLKANSTNNCVLLPQPTNNSDKADTQKDANVFCAAASSTSEATNTDESSDSDNESERNGYNKTDKNQGIENYVEDNNSVNFLSVNASKEVLNPCKHRATAPSCWSVQQQEYFTSTYPWIIFSNGKLGCQECKNIKSLGLHAEQRSRISREWTDCNIFPSTTNNREKSAAEAQKYLRKKISKHARSKAHLTATKVLKEQQNRQIQSSTALSVAQHQSATEKCLRTSYYVAKENRPYLDYENLVTLQQKNGVNLGITLHSRWSCTEMIDTIATTMRQDIVNEITKNNKKIAIIIDEATSNAKDSCLVVYIRSNINGSAVNIF